jgi:hypothetical protein
MNLSAIDWIMWTAIFLGHAALLFILIFRCRWKQFSAFTAFVGFEATWSMVLYATYRYGPHVWYGRIYYTALPLDFILQLGVIGEIARIVMRPTGSWVRDARMQFILWGAAGILFAAALPWLITPPATSLLARMEVRGNLFTSLVVCELIAAVTWTSKSLGLGWRNHVMALGNGWIAWAMIAIVVDGLHSYFGADRYFEGLEHIRMFTYLVVLVYWMVQFWRDEPERRPLSPELRAYIEALHHRVKNHLDTMDAQR